MCFQDTEPYQMASFQCGLIIHDCVMAQGQWDIHLGELIDLLLVQLYQWWMHNHSWFNIHAEVYLHLHTCLAYVEGYGLHSHSVGPASRMKVRQYMDKKEIIMIKRSKLNKKSKTISVGPRMITLSRNNKFAHLVLLLILLRKILY